LINDVLDMAKIEAGRITVQASDFDLAQLLADVKELFRARAAHKRLALHVASAPNAPHFVHTDAGKLRQVLINLLGNAVKFTATGSVELTVTPVDPVTPGADSRLRFVVRDTGPGIAAADLEAIFEPFVQATHGRTVQEGTGLGLPISRQFARLLGGDLTASSPGAAGKGSEFVLEIPVGMVAENTLPVQTATPRRLHLAPDQPVYRLLVAEDRAESRKLLADLLTRLGFAVRTAENGRQALEVWAAWQPHLVWMDINMPVMDGREATRRIKATPQGQGTVVIAVSAGVLREQQAAVLADGCADFVRKPFHQEEIMQCLVKHLGVRMVYTTDKPIAQPAGADTPSTQAWADTSAGWRAQVQQAAVAADAARLHQLAAAVADEQPVLAAALHASIDEFDYGAILDAVADARKDG
jgi:CheY-like chemotaxis protein